MRYDPRDPEWPDRDRFVLSNGHACILQYAMLHLTGYDLSLEDLRQFRQWGSRTPGHPEYHHTAGIEVTTGPARPGLRQRGRHGDRRALAADHLRRRGLRPPAPTSSPGDGCFMEGISHEAASLAGHLGLGRLLAFYDDNHITIDGPTELAYDDDVVRALRGLRLAGAQPRRDGQRRRRPRGRHPRGPRRSPPTGPTRSPPCSSCAATSAGRRPTSPTPRRRTGIPFGEEEIRATKEILGLPPDETFWVPDEVRDFYGSARWRAARRSGPPGRSASRPGRATGPPGTPRRPGTACRGGPTTCPRFEAGTKLATRHAINQCIDATAARLPGLLAGSADLTGQQRREGQGRRDPVAPSRRAGRRSTTGSASTAWARS